MAELSLPEKVIAIDVELTRQKIDHAYGGAIALAYYAEPRATIDIDINIFLEPAKSDAVIGVLGGLGATNNIDRSQVERDGQTRVWWGRNPIDIFFSYDPFHEAMRKRSRSVVFGETRIPVLGPEHLVICKAIFGRPKDWIDIEQVFVGEEILDGDEIWSWMARIVGDRDERALRLRDLWSDAR